MTSERATVRLGKTARPKLARFSTQISSRVLQRKGTEGGTLGHSVEPGRWGNHGTNTPSVVHEGLGPLGHPLESATRAIVEPRFGHDFSRVRLHTDSWAACSARRVGAQAYTLGRNIVFGANQYSPATATGQRLLAHELAHVVQQDLNGSSMPSPAPLSAMELEADRAGHLFVTGGGSISVALKCGAGIARAPLSKDLTKLSDKDLEAERNRAMQWLAQHSLMDRDHPATSQYLEAIEGEARRRKPFGLPSWVVPSPSQTANLGIQSYDATMRINHYVKPAKELATKLFEDYRKGEISHLEARKAANQGRNKLLDQTRKKLTPGGRAFSEGLKETGLTLSDAVRKYSHRVLKEAPWLRKYYGLETVDSKSPLFNAAKYEAALLEVSKTANVSEEVIKAAGRTGRIVTGVAYVSKYLGPVGTGLGLAASTYKIVTAPEGEQLSTLGREASGFAGGVLGSVGGGLLAGWTASLACGPGAPICAILVSITIVGGSAYAGGSIGENVFDLLGAPSGDLLEKPTRSLAPAVSTNVVPRVIPNAAFSR